MYNKKSQNICDFYHGQHEYSAIKNDTILFCSRCGKCLEVSIQLDKKKEEK